MASDCTLRYCGCICNTCELNRGTVFLLLHCKNHDSGCHDRCSGT